MFRKRTAVSARREKACIRTKFLTIPGPRRDGTNDPPRQIQKAHRNSHVSRLHVIHPVFSACLPVRVQEVYKKTPLMWSSCHMLESRPAAQAARRAGAAQRQLAQAAKPECCARCIHAQIF